MKFKDADLIGMPLRVTVGPQGARARLRRAEAPRATSEADEVPVGRGGGARRRRWWARAMSRALAAAAAASRQRARSRLIFALDVDSLRGGGAARASCCAREVGVFKVGKQLFLHAGPRGRAHGAATTAATCSSTSSSTTSRTRWRKAGVEAARLGVRDLRPARLGQLDDDGADRTPR